VPSPTSQHAAGGRPLPYNRCRGAAARPTDDDNDAHSKSPAAALPPRIEAALQGAREPPRVVRKISRAFARRTKPDRRATAGLAGAAAGSSEADVPSGNTHARTAHT